ncbi:unnamed protein product [Cladocopium goreaui]|uniref:Uncharacterized protein n=1 Tax=Cladocopium goreaui TaxID=2562237 RepID=A0A9P1GNV4_9DINO|nr:unnamed protein product [Cladocopium goreaui]CAI4018314.1 unnamed protein product [Cladocopium goreaui]
MIKSADAGDQVADRSVIDGSLDCEKLHWQLPGRMCGAAPSTLPLPPSYRYHHLPIGEFQLWRHLCLGICFTFLAWQFCEADIVGGNLERGIAFYLQRWQRLAEPSNERPGILWDGRNHLLGGSSLPFEDAMERKLHIGMRRLHC